jgi:hypothetical protein
MGAKYEKFGGRDETTPPITLFCFLAVPYVGWKLKEKTSTQQQDNDTST